MKNSAILALATVFAMGCPIGAQSSAQQASSAPAGGRQPHATLPEFIGWVPDELIVIFDDQTRRRVSVGQSPAGVPTTNLPWLRDLLRANAATRIARQFSAAQPQPAGSPFPDLTGHYKVKLGPGVGLERAVRSFEADPNVEHVERIGMHSLYNEPNDPYFRDSPTASFPYDQWHLYAAGGIAADQAWDAQAGSSDVLVGILDSGTRYFHADLGGNSAPWGPDAPFGGGNIFINSGEIPGNGIDDDANGYVDDTIGWDFVSSAGGGGVKCIDQDCSGADNDPDDGNGHGTHVAGTVGAITNNGIQVAGVAGGFSDGSGVGNGVKIVPLRIGYHARYHGQVTGIVRMDWAAEAMDYLSGLVDRGFNVASINCSWGSSNSGGLGAAVDNLQAHDVLIVHAAGNSGSSSADFLGTKAGVMNVAATDANSNGASFTNHGSWVDVAAPGVDILSTYRSPDDPDPTAHYIGILSGTSMSSPHVAGIAALLESCTPSLSRTDKFNLIVGNTNPYSDSRDLGAGIANAKLALDAAGCSGVNCDIAADFSASVTSGCTSLGVVFADLSSGTAINGWSWDFGDGNTSTAQNPSHDYTTAGTFSVSLTASSNTCSASLTKSAYITVSAEPIADFSGSPTSGPVPLTVNFGDTSSGLPNAWTWDFGDSSSSNAQSPSHTYTSTGTYTVTLTASNVCGGDSLTRVAYITVTAVADATHVFVADITVTRENLGQGFKRGIATILMQDNTGQPVAGATVMGDFSGKTSDSGLVGVTDSNGELVLYSSSAKGGGEWCFEVTGVSHGTLTYDSGLNLVTQSCEGGDVF